MQLWVRLWQRGEKTGFTGGKYAYADRKKQHWETILTELNDILPENLWKTMNKIPIQYVIAVKSGVKQTELAFANVRICVVFVFI